MFSQGIHPAECKAQTEQAPIQVLPTPPTIFIPLRQHLGAPCKAVVECGAEVALGQILAEEGGFISTRIHASAPGKVKSISPRWHSNGLKELTIEIEVTEGFTTPSPDGSVDASALDRIQARDILARIQESGLVGMGGAGSPTHLKLQPPPTKKIDTAILNGCECEPYLNADNRLMIERPDACVFGFRAIMKALGVRKGIIAIESNKLEAAAKMRKAAESDKSLGICILQTKYPQGAEKMTILVATGRTVPEGGLPMDVGVVVNNVGTAVAVTEALLSNKALTHRVLTVAGAVQKPGNLYAPIGATLADCIAFSGGLKPEACAVILGGPMMGITVADLDASVIKTTSGIVALTKDDLQIMDESPCIRCGRCVDHCPLSLIPSQLCRMAKRGDWERLKKEFHIMNCMECGCCAYVCPARIPLVQYVKVAKTQLPK